MAKKAKKKRYKALVVVESPAKARKIAGFLGSDYKVMASMGHLRDLPASAAEIPAEIKKEPWANLGVNVERDFEPVYVIPRGKKKIVRELKAALKDCDELILATDEDREGESIGWHLVQLLEPKVPVKRMVFSEITKSAIQEAMRNLRDVDQHLVEAQETRRVLDRLYGYRLSPLLWKKIARGLSAGRVQSVAVRLLVERELQRMAFRKAEYWDLKATVRTPRDEAFETTMAFLDGKRLATGKDFDERTGKLKPDADVVLLDEQRATELAEQLRRRPWVVADIEERTETRKPYPPFTTSTLQQEANRKLGWSAQQTMQVAQRLYENGYITYMRTDSVHLSQEAIRAARRRIADNYGAEYLSDQPRQFTTRTRGAQEAHEAIRPAGDEMKTADELGLSGQDAALYALIWKRTMATQMAEARLRFQTIRIQANGAEFRTTGRRIEFPGFFRAYVEGVDDPEAALDDQENILPHVEPNEPLRPEEIRPQRHETKPPPRYTEATLVRALEAEGIGRPSTYASIIGTIQDRGYVRKVGNQLVPTFTAIAVTKLLEKYFPKLVDLKFTAEMEQALDDVAAGTAERLPYLRAFYLGEDGLDTQVRQKEQTIDPREACTVRLDNLNTDIRVGRFGPYLEKRLEAERGKEQVITASLPPDIAPADIDEALAEQLFQQKQQGPRTLGTDPETGQPIYVMTGRFGPYLQLGDVTDENPKPKRVSIPKTIDPETIDRETALKLLALPRELGTHPETGQPVLAGIGRYGPYVQHGRTYKSLGPQDDVATITLERALELLKQARSREPIRELGRHPDDGEPIAIYSGRYGPYIKYGKLNVTLPKGREPQEVTLEEALDLIREKQAKGSARSRGRTRKAGKK
ncbi:MAG: type I DNA topoisomerase [Planctomycetota bacterium]|nr:MAG: type I DNA topoisomerase [Planctomycetota bacterium]